MSDITNIPPGWFPETVEAEFGTNDEAIKALQKVKEVMMIIATVKKNRDDWPKIEEWKNILPDWLLLAFRSEYTEEEVKELLKNKQPRSGWTLEDWQFYIKNKVWEWVDGKAENNKLLLDILVDGHPFSIYELKSILELFGATSVQLVDQIKKA